MNEKKLIEFLIRLFSIIIIFNWIWFLFIYPFWFIIPLNLYLFWFLICFTIIYIEIIISEKRTKNE